MSFNIEQITDFISTHFPHANKRFTITEVGENTASLIFNIKQDSLRPGGTVSGPTLMMIADFALYVAIIAKLETGKQAVTTNLSFNFFRKGSGEHDIRAECRLLKVGRTLATGEVFLYSLNSDEPVAHAMGTFAL